MVTPSPVFIIAEAGVNHDGSLDRALTLVDAAAAAGADCVKFQTFRADRLVTRTASKAAYQVANTGADDGQFAMLKALELDEAAHRALAERCRVAGIEFLSTPFDTESLRWLVRDFGMKRVKLSSGDLTNPLMLLEAARSGADQIIISTGMASMAEIEEALGVLAFGLGGGTAPSRAAFREAWADGPSRALVRERVVVLHCTTEYPAPVDEVNLTAMGAIGRAFDVHVGYSDHTEGVAVPVAAAALGARVIEKHFTLDRSAPGPDHAASLEPADLAAMVAAIRTIEAALGDGVKVPGRRERANAPIARKSLTAARDIAQGEIVTAEALAVKRPGTGASPMEYWDVLGKPARRAYGADETFDP